MQPDFFPDGTPSIGDCADALAHCLMAARESGCTCSPSAVIESVDLTLYHVDLLHDSWCPLIAGAN